MTDDKYCDILIKYIKSFEINNCNLTFDIVNDYKIMLELIKYNYIYIKYASKELQNNLVYHSLLKN